MYTFSVMVSVSRDAIRFNHQFKIKQYLLISVQNQNKAKVKKSGRTNNITLSSWAIFISNTKNFSVK